MKHFQLLFAAAVLAVLAEGHVLQGPGQTNLVVSNNNAHQRRWFGFAAAPAVVCPTVLPDFAVFEASKDLCNQDFSK